MKKYFYLLLFNITSLLVNAQNDSYNQTKYYNYGLQKMEQGNYLGAITDFNRAIELNPNQSGGVYLSRGEAKSKLGDYRGAISDYDINLKYSPGNPISHLFRGQAKLQLNKYTEAIEDFTVTVNSGFVDGFSLAYLGIGVAQSRLGKNKEALKSLSNSINYNSKQVQAYIERAYIRFKIGEKNNACLDLSKAGELGEMSAYEAIRKYCN